MEKNPIPNHPAGMVLKPCKYWINLAVLRWWPFWDGEFTWPFQSKVVVGESQGPGICRFTTTLQYGKWCRAPFPYKKPMDTYVQLLSSLEVGFAQQHLRGHVTVDRLQPLCWTQPRPQRNATGKHGSFREKMANECLRKWDFFGKLSFTVKKKTTSLRKSPTNHENDPKNSHKLG